MLHWLRDFYRGVPATFHSTRSLDDCVVRLRQRVCPSVFSFPGRECAVGRVERDGVRLQRLRPFLRNSFKPIFVGRFHADKAGTILAGRFTMFLFAKLFMTAWLGFVVFWTLMATVMAVAFQFFPPEEGMSGPSLLILPLAGITFFFVGLVFFRFCWNISSGDVTYLTSIIEEALQDDPKSS